ncbi:MAG: alpha-amylase family glycosyl hydrolase, partial [Streptococcus mitis]|nr:alpha-amylase family glycosyl hydrolase [Streptococcus mitis]
HDTERILWTANEDVQLVKSALAFLFLQKGTPCIYSGTELALTGGPDPDCRRCMPWERVSSDNDMLNFMKKLIHIRKQASATIQHDKYNLQEIKPDLVALQWKYEGRILKAIFNQSKEDYHLQKEAVALASNCQELENQLVISPKGFVIFH